MRRPGRTAVRLAFSWAVLGGYLVTLVGATPEPPPAGVVTALEGRANVMHASAASPATLQQDDPVFVRDRIATGEQSVARLLLGAKATVTVREQSTLLITDAAGTAKLDLSAGKIGTYVMRGQMQPGETVEIHTPNAIVGVRGTVLTVEVDRDAASNHTSSVTVLQGSVEVTHRDPVTGRVTGAPVTVGQHQRVTVTRSGVAKPLGIRPADAARMATEFRLTPTHLLTDAKRAAALRSRMRQAGRGQRRPARLDAGGRSMSSSAASAEGSGRLGRPREYMSVPSGGAKSDTARLQQHAGQKPRPSTTRVRPRPTSRTRPALEERDRLRRT